MSPIQGPPPSPFRIAIVGAGISGLVAAAELCRAGHEITLFEAGAYAGGHTNTVTVSEGERGIAVDTGFIVLNDRNYPNFEEILAELGVATQPSTMSFGVSDGRGDFEWAARPRGLFAKPAHAVDPRFLRMIAELVRFNRDSKRLIGLNGSGPTLRDFLAENEYSEYFVERLIVPQVSAVWSADPEQLWSFPASFLAEFFHNHGTLELTGKPQWRTITGGSRRYVEALTAPFAKRIQLNAPVRSIVRENEGVTVQLDDASERFDEVVLACHSDQALELLASPTGTEAETLGAIAYQRNEAVLHTDISLMPKRRSAWASWNFHLAGSSPGKTTVTYDMNRLQSLDAERNYLVTLNRSEAIDPSQVIRRISYEHPVFTKSGITAQSRWTEISGADRIHYCGAYWRWGFHEDGVWSGLRVSAALGGRGPGLGGKVPAAIDAQRERQVVTG